MKRKVLLFSALFSMSYFSFSQETLSLKPDGTVGRDACLFSNVAAGHNTTNYGVWNDFLASAWTHLGTSSNVRALIQFDLSAIPAGSTITSAYLTLYHNPISVNTGHSTSSGSNACYLQRVTSSWDELIVTWDTQPTTTNVDQVNVPQSTTTDEDYIDIDVTTLITYFYNNPTENFGMMLRLQNESYYRSLLFSSSDHPDPLLWPELEENYTTNASIQENSNAIEVSLINHGSDQILISGKLDKVSSINICNSIGQVVFSSKLNCLDGQSQILNTSGFAQGFYAVSFLNEFGEVISAQKIILN